MAAGSAQGQDGRRRGSLWITHIREPQEPVRCVWAWWGQSGLCRSLARPDARRVSAVICCSPGTESPAPDGKCRRFQAQCGCAAR